MPPKNTKPYKDKVCTKSSSVPVPNGMGTVMEYSTRLAPLNAMKNMVKGDIMILASYKCSGPTADISQAPSSRDPLSSIPSSAISLSICVCCHR